jgi:UDPglucose 6-dehydrogenase
MNELANLAESVGADIEHVRRGIGSDPRIGYDFLYAGCGYGGSCFPKDVQALVRTAHDDAQMTLKVMSAVEAANEAQKLVLPLKVKKRFGGDLRGLRFALWGLAFKPNTDDMREAPSRTIVKELLAAGAEVHAYDPVAIGEARKAFGDQPRLRFCESAMEALEGADALLIATEWKEFRSPDFDGMAAALKQPVIFDGRNLYEPAAVRARGFEYHGIGRP